MRARKPFTTQSEVNLRIIHCRTGVNWRFYIVFWGGRTRQNEWIMRVRASFIALESAIAAPSPSMTKVDLEAVC